MCHSTLAIYCFIDDFLKASGHSEDIRIEVMDFSITQTFERLLRRTCFMGQDQAQARENRSLDDLPLSVISASMMPDASPGIISINHAMHRELAELSSVGTQKIIEGSDHFTVLMRREYAQIIAQEIINIVEES